MCRFCDMHKKEAAGTDARRPFEVSEGAYRETLRQRRGQEKAVAAGGFQPKETIRLELNTRRCRETSRSPNDDSCQAP